MIKTTFEFLVVFAILVVLLHLVLIPKIKSRRFWFFAEWFAVFAIGCRMHHRRRRSARSHAEEKASGLPRSPADAPEYRPRPGGGNDSLLPQAC